MEEEDDREPEPSVEVRITARLVTGGRIEFALQQRTDGTWGSQRRPSQRRPSQRYFPPDTRVGRWLRASRQEHHDGQRLPGRRMHDGMPPLIRARRVLADLPAEAQMRA